MRMVREKSQHCFCSIKNLWQWFDEDDDDDDDDNEEELFVDLFGAADAKDDVRTFMLIFAAVESSIDGSFDDAVSFDVDPVDSDWSSEQLKLYLNRSA